MQQWNYHCCFSHQYTRCDSHIQELQRANPLPGDPYRSDQPVKKKKRFSPSHHEIPWLPKLAESDLKMHV